MKTKTIAFLVVAVALLGGLFLLLKPKSTNPAPTANTQLQEKTFEFLVKNKKIFSGDTTFKATEGDIVTMKITLDENEEVHLHGYDKKIELEKNVTGKLSFTATLTGRFPFELEGSGTELGVLEVMPK